MVGARLHLPRCPCPPHTFPGATTGMKKGPLKREPKKGGCRRLLLRHYYEKIYLKVLAGFFVFDGFIICNNREGIVCRS